MADPEALRSLMRSPLEEETPPSSGPGRSLAAILGLAGVGGLLVLGGYVLASGSEATPVAVTTTALPSATTAITGSVGFPHGYVAINDRVAVRAERVLIRDNVVYVSLSQAVLADLDAAASAGFSAGLWTLQAAGAEFPMLSEFRSDNAPGTFTVAFDAAGVVAGSLESLRLTAEGVSLGANETQSFEAPAGLPLAVELAAIPLGAGASLEIDEVTLGAEGGRVSWHIEGDSAVRGAVTVFVSLFAGDATAPAAYMSPSDPANFLRSFGSAAPQRSLQSSGVIDLTPPSPDTQASDYTGPQDVTGGEIEWTVDWVSYLPAAATVPLAGVGTIAIGG